MRVEKYRNTRFIVVESVYLRIFILLFQRFAESGDLYMRRHQALSYLSGRFNRKFRRNQELLTSYLNFDQSFAENRYVAVVRSDIFLEPFKKCKNGIKITESCFHKQSLLLDSIQYEHNKYFINSGICKASSI